MYVHNDNEYTILYNVFNVFEVLLCGYFKQYFISVEVVSTPQLWVKILYEILLKKYLIQKSFIYKTSHLQKSFIYVIKVS